MMHRVLWNYLMAVALALELIFGTCAFVYIVRLLKRRPVPLTNEVRSVPMVLSKLRKSEPMPDDELALARLAVDARSILLALSIPAAFFTMGCFYVFGSLEHLHGATPSERTFLAVIPMVTSTNIFIRLVGSTRLKHPLRQYITQAHAPQRAAPDAHAARVGLGAST
jgi:hypothetical protein